MSVKIYDGMITATAMLPLEVMELVDMIREQAQEKVNHYIKQEVIERAVRAYDDAIDTEGRSCMMYGVKSMDDGIQDSAKSMYRDPFHDIEFTLNFYPTNDGRWLVLPFAEKSFYHEILRDCEHIKDYGYWDNTDAPDGVSSREWKKRRKLWLDHAMRHDTPAESMFGVNIVLQRFPWRLFGRRWMKEDKIAQLIPSFEKRVKRILTNKTIRMYCEERGIDMNSSKPSEIIRAYSDSKDWALEDGAEKVAAERERIESRLVKNLTIDDLLERLDPVE